VTWGPMVPSRPGRLAVPPAVLATYARLMKHMLLAIDRGAPSWEATRLAVHLAPKLKAPVTVLSLLVPGPQRRETKDQRGREYAAVRELVDDVVKELVGAGVKAKGEVRSCKPKEVAAEILGSATRHGADMIVMGSRARGELTGLLLGSVSDQVAMGTQCPVVLVPTGAMTKLTPRRIVLVIDGEGEPGPPVAVTAAIARALKAAVEVLCVGRTFVYSVEPAKSSTAANPDEEAVATAAAALKKAGLEVRTRMIDNQRGFAPEIAREVMATGADMIVIGSRAMGWVGNDIASGAAEAVIRRTRRPVVVAPSRRRI
jgi:nucleotide-binding universal stress UspA family protein